MLYLRRSLSLAWEDFRMHMKPPRAWVEVVAAPVASSKQHMNFQLRAILPMPLTPSSLENENFVKNELSATC